MTHVYTSFVGQQSHLLTLVFITQHSHICLLLLLRTTRQVHTNLIESKNEHETLMHLENKLKVTNFRF